MRCWWGSTQVVEETPYLVMGAMVETTIRMALLGWQEQGLEEEDVADFHLEEADLGPLAVLVAS